MVRKDMAAVVEARSTQKEGEQEKVSVVEGSGLASLDALEVRWGCWVAIQ